MTKKWEVIKSQGPSSRDDHTAVAYEGSMIVFGGYLESGERTNEVWRYHFKEGKWEIVVAMGKLKPEPRAGHSAIIYGDAMVVFGGKDDENNKLNDLWVFSMATY